jgi:hypothetical protein
MPFRGARLVGRLISATIRERIGRPRNRDHVIYESRLELANPLFSNFDQTVHRILPQPFMLRALVDREMRSTSG